MWFYKWKWRDKNTSNNIGQNKTAVSERRLGLIGKIEGKVCFVYGLAFWVKKFNPEKRMSSAPFFERKHKICASGWRPLTRERGTTFCSWIYHPHSSYNILCLRTCTLRVYYACSNASIVQWTWCPSTVSMASVSIQYLAKSESDSWVSAISLAE